MDSSRLAALLRPWGELLATPANYDARFKNAQRVDLGVELTLRVDVSAEFSSVLGDLDTIAYYLTCSNKLSQLREAIDALAVAAYSNPSLLVEALDLALDEDVSAALRRGAALDLRVVVVAKKLSTIARLKRRLRQLFLVEQDQGSPSSAAFGVLCKEIGSNVMGPVSIVFDVSTEGDEDPQAIWHLMEFVHFLHAHRTLGTATASGENSHAPLRVEKVMFAAHRLLLTRNAVEDIHGLLDVSEGFFQCDYITCNAQEVDCSSEELTNFFNTLSRGSPDGKITINPLDVKDPSDIAAMLAPQCEKLIRSAAACERVNEVRLGGLLDACTRDDARTVFFSTMVDAVFGRATPISLNFDTRTIKIDDAALLSDAVGRWRKTPSHAEAKLRVSDLQLEVPFRHNAFILASFNAIDEIKSIAMDGMNNVYGLPITCEMLTTIVAKFPSLTEIGFTEVGVDSMELFIEGPCPKLEEIAFCDLMLSNRESLMAFFAALGDPTTRLAQTLRRFIIPNTGMQYATRFRLDAVEANALADAMTTNTVLEYVHVCIEDNQDHVSDKLRQRYDELRGRRLPLHIQLNAQRLALLSCLRSHQGVYHTLDGAIVQHIVELAAPWKKRVVKVDWDTHPRNNSDDEDE